MFAPLRPRTSVLRGIAAGACAAAVLVTAACGSSAGASSTASGSSGSSSASSGAVSADVQDMVKKRLAVTDWKSDAPPVSDVAKVKGGSILYVPISLKI